MLEPADWFVEFESSSILGELMAGAAVIILPWRMLLWTLPLLSGANGGTGSQLVFVMHDSSIAFRSMMVGVFTLAITLLCDLAAAAAICWASFCLSKCWRWATYRRMHFGELVFLWFTKRTRRWVFTIHFNEININSANTVYALRSTTQSHNSVFVFWFWIRLSRCC